MKLVLLALLGCTASHFGHAQTTSRQPAKTSMTTQTTTQPTTDQARRNQQVVDQFFVALETEQFEKLREVFAPDGRQLNPYVPEGFPKSFDGVEAIYKQYSGLPKQFSRMRFPRTIFATADPNVFFVQFRGEIDIRAGGRYENDYIGVFKLANGRIVEYTEYFNPLVMAKAFNIPLTTTK